MTLEATINDRVYAVLARAAAKRRPCPTNQQLAALAQTNATNASYALTKLKALAKIDVEWSGERRRRVTIKVTGMMTGWSEEVCGGARGHRACCAPPVRHGGAMIARAGMPFGDSQGSLIERAIFHGRHAALEAGEKSFARDANRFAAAVSDAMRRRLYPNTNLHAKQLAAAIGMSERAVQMAIAGSAGTHGATVAACIQFFWHHGDRAFIAELYGLPPLGIIADLRRPLLEARAMLDQALGQEVA